MIAIRLAPLVAAVWCASGAFAAGMIASCPGIIPENAIKPDKTIAGWATVIPSQMHLRGAGMMAGAPETKTYLVPDKDVKGVQTFAFAKGDSERWVWCDYGAVELAQRLDDRATVCTITTTTKKPEMFISVSIQCK